MVCVLLALSNQNGISESSDLNIGVTVAFGLSAALSGRLTFGFPMVTANQFSPALVLPGLMFR
jgi:hypothetical protein